MERTRQGLRDGMFRFYMSCQVFFETYGIIQQFLINVARLVGVFEVYIAANSMSLGNKRPLTTDKAKYVIL